MTLVGVLVHQDTFNTFTFSFLFFSVIFSNNLAAHTDLCPSGW